MNKILQQYQNSFNAKSYAEENDDIDVLMEVFNITPLLKRENRQFWGRELGMCWQLLVTELCRQCCSDFSVAEKFGLDSPYDLGVGKFAIDTKYRIGSGDAGTLKKFKAYGPLLQTKGFTPVLLIAREDNLGAAISACISGDWTVITGKNSFDFIEKMTGVDIKQYLINQKGRFPVVR
ncbi:hypothetical protein [Collimonas silvisoli]|uniref:hypothetical protein n=1 Tax=Collimonas silvisoli TaxID=2825884 RepID=UPI001B8C945C|nr:hypothetical protein [Collimonas silvisoli]